MRARPYLALGFGLASLACLAWLPAGCAVIPDPTFETGADSGVGGVSSDATTVTQNPPITSLDAQLEDSAAQSDAPVTVSDSGAATSDDASPPDDASAGSDSSSSPDDASLSNDSSVSPPVDSGGGSLACLPPGAPAGTACCPKSSDPCIGLACSHCGQCNCATGEYCCATENGAGKFKGTVCVASPNAMTCPAN